MLRTAPRDDTVNEEQIRYQRIENKRSCSTMTASDPEGLSKIGDTFEVTACYVGVV